MDYYTYLLELFRALSSEERQATLDAAAFLRSQQRSPQGEEATPSERGQVPAQSE